jgi:integrase
VHNPVLGPATPVATSPQPCLDVAARQQVLATTLARHSDEQRQHWRSASSWHLYDRQHRAFGEFLLTWCGRNDSEAWATASPETVLVFFYEWLLPSVTSRDGTSPASGGTVSNYMSALSTCFRLLFPDRGDWDGHLLRGNPVLSQLVSSAIESYQKQANRAGTRVRSAVPLCTSKVQTLLDELEHGLIVSQHADHLAAGSPTYSSGTVLLARDAALFAICWATGCRVGDISDLIWSSIKLNDVHPSTESLCDVSAERLQRCSRLLLCPDKTKVHQRTRPASIELDTAPVTDAPESWAEYHYCGVFQLIRLQQVLLQSQYSSSLYVFPTVGVRGVSPHLTTNAANGRLRRLLQRCGADAGETMHGFRRGAMQAWQAEGVPAAQIYERVGITTPSVGRVYLDRGRHTA